MTQDEIKKALECCAKSYGDDIHCSDCPYYTLTPRACCETFCQDVLCKDALTLITEQEKSLQEAQDSMLSLAQQNQEYREQQVKQAKIDVLNEVKKRLDSAPNGWAYTTYIDELIEEVQNETVQSRRTCRKDKK